MRAIAPQPTGQGWRGQVNFQKFAAPAEQRLHESVLDDESVTKVPSLLAHGHQHQARLRRRHDEC